MEVNDKVLDALKSAGKPLKSAEISELAGIDKKDVTKAIQKLKKDGLIESPKACYYTIK